MGFKVVDFKSLEFNPATLIGNKWWAICAGNEKDGYNAMTASWGQLGCVWNHNMPTAVVYVRPQRHTKKYLDQAEYYALSILPEEKKDAMVFLGRNSGKDYKDKIEEAGLTAAFTESTMYLEEAEMVFICRKVYAQELSEAGFVDKTIVEKDYPDKDFHTMYVGEIVEVLVKE